MLDAAVKALSQMFSPPFRTVLWKSVGLALVLIVIIGIAVQRLLVWLATYGMDWAEGLLGTSAHTPLSILAWVVSIAVSLGIIVGSIFLMPAVTALVGTFFVDDIALEVERTYYPADPLGSPPPPLRAALEGARTALFSILVYLVAVPFLLVGGLGLVIFFLATAYLLGREYFELAAMPPARGGSQAFAQDAQRHGLCGRHVHRRLRIDTDRQSRRAIVRHGVHGAHVQANGGRSATAHGSATIGTRRRRSVSPVTCSPALSR